MENLKRLRKRIQSIRNTEQITKAMKMVSAAKLRRAQEKAETGRPYNEYLERIVKSMILRTSRQIHPLLAKPNREKCLLIIFTSDRGLCGSFNHNMIKEVEAFINLNPEGFKEFSMIMVGRRGWEYFNKRGYPIVGKFTNLSGSLPPDLPEKIVNEIIERFISGQNDYIYFYYYKFRSAISQKIIKQPLLPIEADEVPKDILPIEYIFEPTPYEVLDKFLTLYLKTTIFQLLLESIASEHGARMTAMDSATNNCIDMIDYLTLKYNRARQSAITLELMDIVGGAEALK
ncbi:MAG: ATP synthase F1 subunit gamma [Spirochaetes bacterium]|nr:ATP synthase F1 subunit gamma [Deltaproteobacteria bacterium]RKY01100.1 MAG: ATP synthase F1 subunit gamma [Spirochaetota bacterium]